MYHVLLQHAIDSHAHRENVIDDSRLPFYVTGRHVHSSPMKSGPNARVRRMPPVFIAKNKGTAHPRAPPHVRASCQVAMPAPRTQRIHKSSVITARRTQLVNSCLRSCSHYIWPVGRRRARHSNPDPSSNRHEKGKLVTKRKRVVRSMQPRRPGKMQTIWTGEVNGCRSARKCRERSSSERSIAASEKGVAVDRAVAPQRTK